MLKKERTKEGKKEQNEKIPNPSIHQSIPSIYCLILFVCLLLSFFCCPSFFCLTLPYCTAVYLDRFVVFELELELGFELGI